MKIICSLLAVVILAGCSAGRKFADLPTDIADYTKEVYQVGVGDQLNIMVWRNPELSITVPVRPDGKISVPLVGDVFAASKSAPELSAEITSALEKFIRSPQVTVIVTNASSTEYINRVRITGAVKQPQSMAFRKGMTVLDLVLIGGGVSDFGKGNDAKLYRSTPEGMKIYDVYIQDILEKGDVRSNYTLMPSDILTVPERAF